MKGHVSLLSLNPGSPSLQQALMHKTLSGIFNFYIQGFRSMTLGRMLWKIIILKLLVIFAVIRVFFCPDYLETRYATDEERADHVMSVIIGSVNSSTGHR